MKRTFLFLKTTHLSSENNINFQTTAISNGKKLAARKWKQHFWFLKTTVCFMKTAFYFVKTTCCVMKTTYWGSDNINFEITAIFNGNNLSVRKWKQHIWVLETTVGFVKTYYFAKTTCCVMKTTYLGSENIDFQVTPIFNWKNGSVRKWKQHFRALKTSFCFIKTAFYLWNYILCFENKIFVGSEYIIHFQLTAIINGKISVWENDHSTSGNNILFY